MRKRGVIFEEYIENYNGNPKILPKYMVNVDGNEKFVVNDDELSNLTKSDEEAQYLEIFEKEDIEIIEKVFQKHDLTIKEFTNPDLSEKYEAGPKQKNKSIEKTKTVNKEPVLKAIFAVDEEKDKHEFFSIQGVLDFVRLQAKKGIYIQRYKGLGEMNPQQLWDTTMDPERRTILQVTLEDAVEVDNTFSMLMGDEVGPRREFIENNAHEVQNLDV